MILMEDVLMKYILMKDVLKNKFIFEKERKIWKLIFLKNKKNIRNIFGVSLSWNTWAAFFWVNIRIFFNVSISWNIRNLFQGGFLLFFELGEKLQGFIWENIRKAFFWENIRIFLILELESSISWNIRSFFISGNIRKASF